MASTFGITLFLLFIASTDLCLPPAHIEKIILIIISFALSVLSYFFIEKPFRNPKKVSRKYFFPLIVGLTSSLLFTGIFIYQKDGFPSRLGLTSDDSFRFHHSHQGKSCHNYELKTPCTFLGSKSSATPHFVLVGDSHAGALRGILAKELLKRGRYSQFTSSACPHITHLKNLERNERFNEDCFQKSLYFKKFIQEHKNLVIIHLSHWNLWLNGRKKQQVVVNTKKGESVSYKLKSELKDWLGYGHKVFFITQPPEFPRNFINPSKHFSQEASLNKLSYPKVSIHQARLRSQPLKEILKSIHHKNFHTFESLNIFCHQGLCSPLFKNKILYTDGDHLSKNGSRFLTKPFLLLLAEKL